MSLKNLIDLSIKRDRNVKEITSDRIKNILPQVRNLIAFYREYPDLFVDFMVWGTHDVDEDMIAEDRSKFRFYFYQRVFLRIVLRHRYVYATFPRGYSKSFLSMLALMVRCILYPGVELFVTTGGKINN